MRVRLLVEVTGTRDGEEWPPKGAEVDLPDVEAASMVRGGLAEVIPIDSAKSAAAETADAAPDGSTPKRPRKR